MQQDFKIGKAREDRIEVCQKNLIARLEEIGTVAMPPFDHEKNLVPLKLPKQVAAEIDRKRIAVCTGIHLRHANAVIQHLFDGIPRLRKLARVMRHDRPDTEQARASLKLMQQHLVAVNRIVLFCHRMSDEGPMNPAPLHFLEQYAGLEVRFDVFRSPFADRGVGIQIHAVVHGVFHTNDRYQ